MNSYSEFVSKNKSMIIAPAGCGKTHAIADCLKFTNGKQLILTHTHAGVASLKEKIKEEEIKSNQYHIETISSYSLKYAKAFSKKEDIPEQSSKEFDWIAIYSKAKEIIKKSIIQSVIQKSYSGLFVDEYQDCSISQHELVMALSDVLPTHIFGDPMQGIFNFNEEALIDWSLIPNSFKENVVQLEKPWRWEKTSRSQLSKFLQEIRERLESLQDINLLNYSSIEGLKVFGINEDDIYDNKRIYHKQINALLSLEKVLLIHPVSNNIYARKKIVEQFYFKKLVLLESIDDKDFYRLAGMIDNIPNVNNYKEMYTIFTELFNKTKLNEWLKPLNIVNKRHEKDRVVLEPIKNDIDKLKNGFSPILFLDLLKKIRQLPDIHIYRIELFFSLFRILEEVESQDLSALDAMINLRNNLRIIGRKIPNKCIGTTLLTKGLEFETVVILNAHKFDSPKHLYVALTRASKELIIFTNNYVLSPYRSN